MEFSPAHPIVQRCLQGMELEEQGKPEEAGHRFLLAWNEATNDFEKFLAAFFVARHQIAADAALQWLETVLQLALKINNPAVQSALAPLYKKIAGCYAALNKPEQAEKYAALAQSCPNEPADPGPFYHGTKAALQGGDLLRPGYASNYQQALTMNHIYFTALKQGAGLAAHLARGAGRERVYRVAPTGSFENDPNVTNKKFPGNPTRSYRSGAPLEIIGEVTDWDRQTPGALQKFRDKLDHNEGAIIN